MASKVNNLNKLLSLDEDDDNEGDLFDLVYRGSSEIDRHYTKPMLPWIISEIKNQHKKIEVTVTIKNGSFEVKNKDTQKVILTHTVKQIHKCVMEQGDHRCFLYTLRANEKEPSKGKNSRYVCDSSTTPQPCNISINQNYFCHLYQAQNEQKVRDFFACLRQQPRECKLQDNDNLNALADLSVHIESQFFEVLFVGRVKVSHCQIPATFIDEALAAFKNKDKSRQRYPSGEKQQRSSPSRMMIFQQEGSGYSVPNIVLRNLCDGELPQVTPRNSKDYGSGEWLPKKEKDSPKTSKVRFDLGASCDLPDDSVDQGSPMGEMSPQSSVSSTSSNPIRMDLREISKDLAASLSSNYGSKNLLSKGEPDSFGGSPSESRNSLFKVDELTQSLSSDSCQTSDGSSNSLGKLLSVEPCQSRSRSISGSDAMVSSTPSDIASQPIEPVTMRSRSGSVGSALSRQRYMRPSESDLKALGYDFNRTMLFHIGHREIQLINPELKSVQLHKPFKDIARWCQGIKHSDHFGFICREMSGETIVYLGYIFRCDKSHVADEIMLVSNRAFSAMHEAHQKERKDHLMCDFCPLKWFSQLCAEVEGLPAPKAHSVIMRKVSSLPDEEREIIIAKYEGAETSELVQKNNVLMMLLRTHFEYKQMNHSHPSESSYARSDSLLGANLETSLKKARKSITTSFNHLLKKREGDSAEREVFRPAEEVARVSPARSPPVTQDKPSLPSAAPSKPATSILEGISDSPLRPYRQRSSTVSGAGGDSMRKELVARKKAVTAKVDKKEKEKENEPPLQRNSGPKVNMFLKFGPSPPPPSTHIEELPTVNENESEDGAKPVVSFRQSILKKVVAPLPKGIAETPPRKVSTGILGKQDKSEFPQQVTKRSTEELMLIWKKAIFQQILLLRIERENQRLRALQNEAALQRVRLNYEEEELPIDTQQVWEMLLSRPNARIDSNLLHSGVKQGVPKQMRGDVWSMLMVQQQLFDQGPRQKQDYPEFFNSPYEEMLKELTSQQHAILIDLGRTFPGHPYFTQTLGPGQLALFNILKAYSILDQDVGYCQGLSFVGGVILLHVEEELAYHLLKYLMYEKECRKQYMPDLDGLQVRMYQLSRLLHDNLHELYEHLEAYEVTPQLYAAPWFMTLFASQFPLNFVVRVFDLLFLFGMEAVFCVALTLLKSHEQDLLAMDSFEQIMDHIKNVVPSMTTSQLRSFFAEVCECNVQKELSAYEVEYQVLREELFLSPQQDAQFSKLKEATKNLKKQNLELLDELHSAKLRQQSLESSNQSLQQSQHHLEVRVRWLEMEKKNMLQLIQILCKNGTKEMFDLVPANLERYLPHKASSPMPEDRWSSNRSNSEERISPQHELRRHSSRPENESPPREFSIQVPRQHSFSPIRTITETPTESLANLQENVSVSSSSSRPRSSTLDPKSMQAYFKNLIRAD